MRKGYDKKREEALRMRIERRSFKETSRKLKISPRTLSRWENGWIDKEGRQHPGWKEKLEKAWEDLEEGELRHGLLLKKERLIAGD